MREYDKWNSNGVIVEGISVRMGGPPPIDERQTLQRAHRKIVSEQSATFLAAKTVICIELGFRFVFRFYFIKSLISRSSPGNLSSTAHSTAAMFVYMSVTNGDTVAWCCCLSPTIYLLRHISSTGEHKHTKHVKSCTIKLQLNYDAANACVTASFIYTTLFTNIHGIAEIRKTTEKKKERNLAIAPMTSIP